MSKCVECGQDTSVRFWIVCMVCFFALGLIVGGLIMQARYQDRVREMGLSASQVETLRSHREEWERPDVGN